MWLNGSAMLSFSFAGFVVGSGWSRPRTVGELAPAAARASSSPDDMPARPTIASSCRSFSRSRRLGLPAGLGAALQRLSSLDGGDSRRSASRSAREEAPQGTGCPSDTEAINGRLGRWALRAALEEARSRPYHAELFFRLA